MTHLRKLIRVADSATTTREKQFSDFFGFHLFFIRDPYDLLARTYHHKRVSLN